MAVTTATHPSTVCQESGGRPRQGLHAHGLAAGKRRYAPAAFLFSPIARLWSFACHYNDVRLHSALGYITPSDFLAGKAEAIWAERDRRLEEARERRRLQRRAARTEPAA